MGNKSDKSTQELRDAKNAANVAGLIKLHPPKKQNKQAGGKKK